MAKLKSVKDAQALVKKLKPAKADEYFVVDDGNIFSDENSANAHAQGQLKIYHLGKKEDK